VVFCSTKIAAVSPSWLSSNQALLFCGTPQFQDQMIPETKKDEEK